MRHALALAAALAALAPAAARAGVISTVAGTGVAGFSGDGGLASKAKLNTPAGVARIPNVGYLIADSQNNRIRKVDLRGVITTVAGRGPTGAGTGGFGGDGGPATSARLNLPVGIAIIPGGGFLFGDSGNNRIREVDANGIITTVAGNGTGGFGGDGGAATAAELSGPEAVALTPDGFVFADTLNHRIRIVGADAKIHTLAGDGTAGFGGDGGAATAAKLNFPAGVALTPSGGYLIADSGNHRIRQVDATTGKITTMAGTGAEGYSGDNGPATAATLDVPVAVQATSNAGFVLADQNNNAVRRVDSNQTITTLAGNGLPGAGGDGVNPLVGPQLSFPGDLAPLPNGDVLIADIENHRMRAVGEDRDGDGRVEFFDNCPDLANADQADLDLDGRGDACDDDVDGDGVKNTADNCPRLANPGQADADHDGTGDACDPTPNPPPPTEPASSPPAAQPPVAAPTTSASSTAIVAPAGPARTAKAAAGITVLGARVTGGVLRLDVTVDRRAAGVLSVTFTAGGRHATFTVPIRGARVAIRHRLPAALRRVRTGTVQVRYGGSDIVSPETGRVRAARAAAGLKVTAAGVRDGKLSVAGTISRRARGVVLVRFAYARPDGSTGITTLTAKVKRGRWAVSDTAPASAGQLSILFTGAGNLRGEQLARRVA